jgi:hypothetical protein
MVRCPISQSHADSPKPGSHANFCGDAFVASHFAKTSAIVYSSVSYYHAEVQKKCSSLRQHQSITIIFKLRVLPPKQERGSHGEFEPRCQP